MKDKVIIHRAAFLTILSLLAAIMLSACSATATPAPVATTAATSATSPAAVATTAATTATSPAAAVATTAASGTTPASAVTTAAATTAATTATSPAAAATTASSSGVAGRTNFACTAPSPAIAANPGKTWLVGIAVQDSIPALDNAIKGVKDGMADCGFVEGKNIRYEMGNALGDIPSLTIVGQKFASLKVDLIVAVGTQALIYMYNTNPTTPIVFNSVTNPYTAVKDVIKSTTDHGTITGIQAAPPIVDALKLAKQLLPNAKNAGLVWTTSEVNSKVTTDQSKAAAPDLGLTIVEGPITKKEDVLQAAQAIGDKVDFFFSTTDVSVVANLEALVQVSIQTKKPIISVDPASAARGAMVAYGIDYYNGGVNSVRLIEKILSGTQVGKIDIEVDKGFYLAVNTKIADQIGFKIPDDILKRAIKIEK